MRWNKKTKEIEKERQLRMMQLGKIADVFVKEGKQLTAVQKIYPKLERRAYLNMVREINEATLQSIEWYLHIFNICSTDQIKGERRDTLFREMADIHLWLRSKSVNQFETYKKFALSCYQSEKYTPIKYFG